MKAYVKAVEYTLPTQVLTNQELAELFPDWSAQKIKEKTGIEERHVTGRDECASDLAVSAAFKLLDTHVVSSKDVDYLILCTQSPDYFLPTTSCILQDRLGLPRDCGAMDFNLGCSGFIYGLGLAKGLIETGQAKNVLFLTAETYSKHIHPADKSVRTIFGDAAAATLICACDSTSDQIGPFVYGTDGSGASNLIVPTGGMRKPRVANPQVTTDESGNRRTENDLYMNGSEIFSFTLRTIPPLVSKLLQSSGLNEQAVDMWVFHQANQFMLEHLRNKLGISMDRFAIAVAKCGNTVSSTIPITLRLLKDQGRLRPGQTVGLVGFGVGYSWGATLIRWQV